MIIVHHDYDSTVFPRLFAIFGIGENLGREWGRQIKKGEIKT